MKKNLKKLVLLHSNDMHGDFLVEEVDKKLVGGVSLLSGYVNKVRQEEPNTLYENEKAYLHSFDLDFALVSCRVRQ